MATFKLRGWEGGPGSAAQRDAAPTPFGAEWELTMQARTMDSALGCAALWMYPLIAGTLQFLNERGREGPDGRG